MNLQIFGKSSRFTNDGLNGRGIHIGALNGYHLVSSSQYAIPQPYPGSPAVAGLSMPFHDIMGSIFNQGHDRRIAGKRPFSFAPFRHYLTFLIQYQRIGNRLRQMKAIRMGGTMPGSGTPQIRNTIQIQRLSPPSSFGSLPDGGQYITGFPGGGNELD